MGGKRKVKRESGKETSSSCVTDTLSVVQINNRALKSPLRSEAPKLFPMKGQKCIWMEGRGPKINVGVI